LSEVCPSCKKRVELTKEEEHNGLKIRSYSCGHTMKHVHVTEHVAIRDEASWVKTSDPISAITRAKESKNYYEALSLACTFFGDYGKDILRWDSKNTGSQISNSKLKNMDLADITEELINRKLIDQATCDQMLDVRQLRNDFQHDGLAFKLNSSQAQKAEDMVTRAIDCVKILKTNYASNVKMS
jgi:hypothetical protein